jgi:hypothetical protein
MINIILGILKTILGMKFGWLIAIIIGFIIGGSIIKNIFSGSFNVAKLVSGFNPFTGAIQGKLIWLAIWCFIFFTAFQFIMRPTYSYDTDYRNNIRNNRDIYLDQRVGDTCIEKCAIAIQPLGFTILKVGCVKSCEVSITQTTKVEKDDTQVVVKKLNPLTAPLRWISKLFKKG